MAIIKPRGHSPHDVQWIGKLGAIAGWVEDRQSDPESAAPEFLPLLLREFSGSLALAVEQWLNGLTSTTEIAGC